MFQGTGSGVGKSIVAAALCRVLARRGIRVAPFKAQNMALNSFVTAEGKEMGRAQVFQAEACGIAPEARMNPILLKPTGDSRSQVIVMGEPVDHYSARDYYTRYNTHLEVVRAAYDSLAADYEAVIIEGAGSPAEINLQKTDLVNMNMAAYASAPVMVIGDIDRGGVFAWMKGTWDLVPDRHRKLVKGFLINKFRGDISLLEPGIRQFEELVPVPVLGTLPWLHGLDVDQEDGCFIHSSAADVRPDEALGIAVIKLPRISNFTDFSPLAFERDVRLVFASEPSGLDDAHCIVIPGTKATASDLQWLRSTGMADVICRRAREGTAMIVGICGGYQMLGMEIHDPCGIESNISVMPGLGLLPLRTEMSSDKELCQRKCTVCMPPVIPHPVEVEGYEIHMGRTLALGAYIPLGPGLDQSTGAASEDFPVWGTYLHGIFANDAFRRRLLDYLRQRAELAPIKRQDSWREHRLSQFDRLADWFEGSVDMEKLAEIIGIV